MGSKILKPKILIALNTAWNIVNFRAGLIIALVDGGYEVVVIAPTDSYAKKIAALGCRFVPIPMDRNGINPLSDFLLCFRFFILMRKEKPDIFLGYTIKPNIYGSIAAHFFQIPVINNIAGLGTTFLRNNLVTYIVRELFRIALFRSSKVFFQNINDRQLFCASRLVLDKVADDLPGSGINLSKFMPSPLPNRFPIRFILIARMLWDKGVGEFIEAAIILKNRGVQAEFCLLGPIDSKNPRGISLNQINEWVSKGVVKYLGASDYVQKEIMDSDCVVLPSYREGLSRALLEAAAMARPIVTTDVPGCREVVDNGINGYLCRSKDPIDLANKLHKIFNLSSSERENMGLQGREKVERNFDEQIVISKYLEAIRLILSCK